MFLLFACGLPVSAWQAPRPVSRASACL